MPAIHCICRGLSCTSRKFRRAESPSILGMESTVSPRTSSLERYGRRKAEQHRRQGETEQCLLKVSAKSEPAVSSPTHTWPPAARCALIEQASARLSSLSPQEERIRCNTPSVPTNVPKEPFPFAVQAQEAEAQVPKAAQLSLRMDTTPGATGLEASITANGSVEAVERLLPPQLPSQRRTSGRSPD